MNYFNNRGQLVSSPTIHAGQYGTWQEQNGGMGFVPGGNPRVVTDPNSSDYIRPVARPQNVQSYMGQGGSAGRQIALPQGMPTPAYPSSNVGPWTVALAGAERRALTSSPANSALSGRDPYGRQINPADGTPADVYSAYRAQATSNADANRAYVLSNQQAAKAELARRSTEAIRNKNADLMAQMYAQGYDMPAFDFDLGSPSTYNYLLAYYRQKQYEATAKRQQPSTSYKGNGGYGYSGGNSGYSGESVEAPYQNPYQYFNA